MCTRWDVEYVTVEFVECECSVDVLDVYCVEIVECVPNGSVDYGYLVEMLRWVVFFVEEPLPFLDHGWYDMRYDGVS